MRRVISVIAALFIISGYANAEQILDEATVTAISQEFTQAIKDGDMSVFEKYMFPETRIVVDMDPAINSGQTEISYEQFMALTEMAIGAMQNAEIHEEVLSFSVDEGTNQATIKEKTTATVEMMGIKVNDVSISTTTYGIVDGEIKVLSVVDELLSSALVE